MYVSESISVIYSFYNFCNKINQPFKQIFINKKNETHTPLFLMENKNYTLINNFFLLICSHSENFNYCLKIRKKQVIWSVFKFAIEWELWENNYFQILTIFKKKLFTKGYKYE